MRNFVELVAYIDNETAEHIPDSFKSCANEINNRRDRANRRYSYCTFTVFFNHRDTLEQVFERLFAMLPPKDEWEALRNATMSKNLKDPLRLVCVVDFKNDDVPVRLRLSVKTMVSLAERGLQFGLDIYG